jgi:hypothetical protein
MEKNLDFGFLPTGVNGSPREPHPYQPQQDPQRKVDQDTFGVEDPAVERFGQSFARPAG